MAQKKLTYQNKVNPSPVVSRNKQATAEDFNDIKSVVNDNSTDAEGRFNNLEENQITGVETYPTYADLPNPGTLLVSYKVTNDPTPSLNGFYHWDGAVYVKDADINQDIIDDVAANRLKTNQQTSYPFADDAECLQPSFDFDLSRRFLVDLHLDGVRDPTKEYSPAIIRRNNLGWEVRIYEETPVASGLPVVFSNVCNFISAVDPEDGDNITIHALTEVGGSGISGKVAVRWSEIPDGIYIQNAWASGDNKYKLSIDIFDPKKSYYLQPNEEDVRETYLERYQYDSATSEISPSFGESISRGIPFSGWGSDFNKVGVSFNALFIDNIKRNTPLSDSEKWSFMKVFVKNNKADAVPIAISPFIDLNPNADVLNDILLPLIDPVTGESLTLDDDSFSGATYFIGYIFYNSIKNAAYGGESSGSQSNFAGTSWYNSNTDDTTWTSYTANEPILFEHLLAVNIDTYLSLIQSEELASRVDVLESKESNTELVVPDKLTAIVGTPLQIFYHGLIVSTRPYNYNIVIDCDKGNAYPRYWQFTPLIGDIGSYTFIIELRDDSDNLIDTASMIIEVLSFVQNPIIQQNILCVGDSLNNEADDWGDKLANQIVDGTDILPGLTNVSNIDFIGEVGIAPKQYTGYGGWNWNNYNVAPNPATSDVWVYCSHDKDETDQQSIWEDAGTNQWQLETIELNRLKFKRFGGHSANMPTAPESLIYVANAVHQSIINYTATQIADGNPFWDPVGGDVDFVNWFQTKYPTKYAGGQVINSCFALFGWNGSPYEKFTEASWGDYIDTAKQFIDNLHDDYPDCKVYVMGIQYPSLNGGLGANYGSRSDYYSGLWSVIRSVNSLNKAYQTLCNDASYSSFCTFINISGQFDSENNMPEGDEFVNIRSVKTEKRGTNGVHPSDDGYLQIADSALRVIIKDFCQ